MPERQLPTHRVFVPDARGNGGYLRATWHPDTRVIVISHWHGDVCMASTPVALDEASHLIGLLVTALDETASAAPAASAPAAAVLRRLPPPDDEHAAGQTL